MIYVKINYHYNYWNIENERSESRSQGNTMYMFMFIPSLSSVVILNKSHGVQGSLIDFYSLAPHC